MKNHDMPEFSQLLTRISSHYKQHMTESDLDIYWQMLNEFEILDIQEAFYVYMKNPDTGQFLPKAADISRYLKGGSETQALQAWSCVQKIMREVGSYESLVFDDAILHRVIEDMGGWIRLCEHTIKEMDFLMHEFKKRYAAYVLHPPTSYPCQLIGRFAWNNNQLGHENQPLLLIGNPEKAKQVYQQGRTSGLSSPITRLLLSRHDEGTPTKPANETFFLSDHTTAWEEN